MKEPTGLTTFLICVALLFAHVILARTAVVQKNSVYDEPLHTASGWLVRHASDYRSDAEDPALFLWYAALPVSRLDMDFAPHADLLSQITENHPQQWPLVTGALYRTPGVDGEANVQRARLLFLPITFLLGATIAWLGYTLGGSFAAIIATTIYALDPNFLGHGAIVKNDVMLSLFMLLFSINLWRLGQRVTAWNVLSLGLIIGGGLCVKFSGMLFVPMLMAGLMIRILLRLPWRVLRLEATTPAGRAAVAAGVILITGIVSLAVIWGVYRFRFLPSNQTQVFNMDKLAWLAKANGLTAKIADPNAPPPSDQEIAAFPPSLLARGILFCNKHQLLPQAWLAGLLYTHATTQTRSTYLLGQYSFVGWWYFFPVAMLVKTPTATLAALLATTALLVRKKAPWAANWTVWSLLIAPVIYFAMAVVSNLNLGLRHILPVYPILFVLVAVTLTRCLESPKWRRAIFGLGVLLVAESIVTYPNYIAFFNAPSDRTIGRLNLLSDSSFDWGQDIKTLRKWQEKHPDVHIYFAGFGMVDADVYGLKRTDLVDNRGFTIPQPLGRREGVIAISATVLQGPYLSEQHRAIYGAFRKLKPREILGDTIYLYDWP